MNKPKALITNINKIILVTILVLFATLTVLPITVNAQPAPPDIPSADPPVVPEPGTEAGTEAGTEPGTEAGTEAEAGGGTTSAAKQDVCAGLELATGQGCAEPADGETSVESVIATVVNILSWIVGVAAVIMLIISGLRFVTSNGDTQSVTNAKNGIIFAVIGLLVVAFAQVIVQFVVNTAT